MNEQIYDQGVIVAGNGEKLRKTVFQGCADIELGVEQTEPNPLQNTMSYLLHYTLKKKKTKFFPLFLSPI
jgi:hypothetical protein